MKLGAKTIAVLKNFYSINPSILIREGNKISTISPSKTIMAKAVLQDSFPQKFAIYNLSEFLGTMSLIEDPDLTFTDNSVKINGKTTRFSEIRFADESTIKTPPDKEIKLPSVDVEFEISTDTIREIERALGTLSLPEISISGDGSKLTINAVNSKNPTSNIFGEELGDTDKTFTAIFKAENIKLLPGKYTVSISSKGISHFKGEEAEYWIAVESSSSFG
jgi:hypothetical protein